MKTLVVNQHILNCWKSKVIRNRLFDVLVTLARQLVSSKTCCVHSPWLAYLSAVQVLECWRWRDSRPKQIRQVLEKKKQKNNTHTVICYSVSDEGKIGRRRTSLSFGSSLRPRRPPLSCSRPLSSRLRCSSSATRALRLLSSKHSSSSERPVRRASTVFSLRRGKRGRGCEQSVVRGQKEQEFLSLSKGKHERLTCAVCSL